MIVIVSACTAVLDRFHPLSCDVLSSIVRNSIMILLLLLVEVMVLCSSQCCVLHDLQFVNASRGCNRRPYRRGILQSRSHNCFIGSHECILLFTPSFCSECFYDL